MRSSLSDGRNPSSVYGRFHQSDISYDIFVHDSLNLVLLEMSEIMSKVPHSNTGLYICIHHLVSKIQRRYPGSILVSP